MTYPYNDSNMIFDSAKGRYILTENALIQNGVNIRSRLIQGAAGAETIIARILDYSSMMIYNYIHQFSFDNNRQDERIATIPSLRKIIYEAMLNQTEYLLLNGDFSRSADEAKRKLAIDDAAKQILNRVVPELGVPITYSGGR